MIEVVTTLLAFIFVLGVLVFVHELGHFLVAKKSGIRVETFSLGFPPKAIGVTVGETEYCISWLPLGGYVKVAGMADFGSEEVKGEPWEFQSKPTWIRMAVMAAGPAMNFLLAFLIVLGIRLVAGEVWYESRIGRILPESPLAAALQPGDRVDAVEGRSVTDWESLADALLASQGTQVTIDVTREDQLLQVSAVVPPLERRATQASFIDLLGVEPFHPAKVGPVLSGSPAEAVGLQTKDLVVAIDGIVVRHWFEMSEQISKRPGEEIEIRWMRDGEEMSATITPRPEQKDGETVGLIGIGWLDEPQRRPISMGKAFGRSAQELWAYTTALFHFLERLVSGQESGRALAGPLAIAQMAGRNAEKGMVSLLSFMALLSVNLAVLNLLPIPMLDGGHLLILAVEAVIRRPLSFRQKEVLQQVGFAFLLFVMIYVTFGDLSRMFGWMN
jgi:regulator of sigma E protease